MKAFVDLIKRTTVDRRPARCAYSAHGHMANKSEKNVLIKLLLFVLTQLKLKRKKQFVILKNNKTTNKLLRRLLKTNFCSVLHWFYKNNKEFTETVDF